MAKDDDMYGLVCKERFDKMLKEETLKTLRSLVCKERFDEKSDPGLADEIRKLKNSRRRIWAAGVILGAIAVHITHIVAQLISGLLQ